MQRYDAEGLPHKDGCYVLHKDAQRNGRDCFKVGIQLALIFGNESARSIIKQLEEQEREAEERATRPSTGGGATGSENQGHDITRGKGT